MIILIILHVLGATIWVGGHLILSLVVLPDAWKKKDYKIISAFEDTFEKIGIPALALQIITGVWMSYLYLPFSKWFDFSDRISILINVKLILLGLTIALAIHARFVIIPKLDNSKIPLLASHIIAVTIIGIIFIIVGLSFRLGFLF
jgi:putative copper export protein